MPSNEAASLPVYTIWYADETRTGTAEDLLEKIRSEAAKQSAEIRKLSTTEYAKRIVADVDFFLPKDLVSFLRKENYPTDFDRALRYLSEMSDSGVRILVRKEA